MEKREPSYPVGGDEVGAATMENSMEVPQNSVATWFSNPTTGHISGENVNSKRYMYPNVHKSTIYNSQDKEAT